MLWDEKEFEMLLQLLKLKELITIIGLFGYMVILLKEFKIFNSMLFGFV
jgi:hypothetical protein